LIIQGQGQYNLITASTQGIFAFSTHNLFTQGRTEAIRYKCWQTAHSTFFWWSQTLDSSRHAKKCQPFKNFQMCTNLKPVLPAGVIAHSEMVKHAPQVLQPNHLPFLLLEALLLAALPYLLTEPSPSAMFFNCS